jgi:putative ABC transport system permease protein
MLSNYLKIALRGFRKNRLFTLVNFAGLSIGLTFCFLTLLWYRFEHSYDQFHPTADRLYRMNYEVGFTGTDMILSRCPSILGPSLPNYFPEIEKTARLYPRSLSVRNPANNTDFELENVMFADSTTQAVFGLDFLHGDPNTSLFQPQTLVLTEQTAQLIFKKTNAIGEKLMLAGTGPYTVTGIVRAFPENAHLEFDMLAPYRNMTDVEPEYARENLRKNLEVNRLASHSYTYALLRAEADVAKVNARFPEFVKENGQPQLKDKQGFSLFPVRDLHLHSPAEEEPVPAADPLWLRVFIVAGLLILLIAAINFINLSTAAHLGRVKEVGMRKVLGAARRQIVGQLLGETLLLGFGSFLLALCAATVFLPQFSDLLGHRVGRSFVLESGLLPIFGLVFLAISVVAGLYPAVFGSRFNPMGLIRSQQYTSGGGMDGWLGKSLITLQFVVAVALGIGTIVILRQVDFLKNRPLGFDRDLVLDVPLFSANMNALFAPGDAQMRSRTNAFEEKLLQNPNIKAVTLATNLPGLGNARHPIATEKIRIEDGMMLPLISVDYDFSEAFGLKMVAGRDFDKSYGTDHLEGYIVNEVAVKTLGFGTPDSAIGQTIQRGGRPPGRVVGVVADFHSETLHNALSPLIMEVNPGAFSNFGIKISNGNLPETMAFIARTWRDFFPEKVFESRFLEDNIQDSYAAESRLSHMIGLFAGVAIFLSCFGLFGLISYLVQSKTREIGIRKVLGASVGSVVGLLSKNFLLLVSIAILIASPLAYYFMDKWLADFAYRIDLQWWMFAAAGAMAVAIAFLTLSFQSVRAALANPVSSLRSE